MYERKSKSNTEDMDDEDTDTECGAVWFRNVDSGYKKDLRLLKRELGEERRKSSGQNTTHMKKHWKRLERKDPSYMYAQ